MAKDFKGIIITTKEKFKPEMVQDGYIVATDEEQERVIVENVLTSISTANALSANMGRVLNERITTELGNLEAILAEV